MDTGHAMACDIVSLHVPLKKQESHATGCLINKNNIQYLQADGLFINTSRGGVVDEKALLA